MSDDEERSLLADQTEYMNGWTYGNRVYKERGDDPVWLMCEALRRAVDIRDKLPGMDLGGRPVMLVDVLNELSDALGYDTYAGLWSNWREPGSQTP